MTGSVGAAGARARLTAGCFGVWYTSLNLRVGGALCTDRCGRSSSDGGARRPGLDLSWSTANTTVLTVGQWLLINGPARLKGVCVIGVEEHVWRHTP